MRDVSNKYGVSRPEQVATMRRLGMTPAEMAEEIGVTVGAINAYTHVALQRGLCERKYGRGASAKYVQAAKIFMEANKTLSVSASTTKVCRELGVSRKAASVLLAHARKQKCLPPVKKKLSGDMAGLNDLLDASVLSWLKDRRREGQTDMDTVAEILTDAFLARPRSGV